MLNARLPVFTLQQISKYKEDHDKQQDAVLHVLSLSKASTYSGKLPDRKSTIVFSWCQLSRAINNFKNSALIFRCCPKLNPFEPFHSYELTSLQTVR